MDLVFIVKTSLSSPALTGSMFEEKIMDNGDDVESFKSSATKVDPAVPASLTWQRKIDSEAKMPRGFNLTAKEIFHMAPTGIRLWFLAREEAAKGRLAFIDPFTKYSVTSSHGVPLGGIGGGSIGRSFKGEFQRWQIFPPKCEDEPVLANQFSHQFVAVTEWSGGLYVSPTITGSRPGSLVAGAWAAMMYLGEEGWHLNALQRPNSIHICIILQHVPVVDDFLQDLREAVATVKANPGPITGGLAPIYRAAGKMPDRGMVNEPLVSFMKNHDDKQLVTELMAIYRASYIIRLV